MKMPSKAVLFCFVAATAFVLASVAPDGAEPTGTSMAPNLTGKMASSRFLIGSWECITHESAAEGSPASTETAGLDFSTAPNNTLHLSVRARDYQSDEYDGYDPKAKHWWVVAVDNQGGRVFETSADDKTYTGTYTMGAQTTPIRETRKKVSDKKIVQTSEIQEKGVWQRINDSVCTRGVVAASIAPDKAQPAGGLTVPNLTGKMASWRVLLGSWECSIRTPVGGGSPASTQIIALTFSVAPNDTVHVSTQTRDSDEYDGYDQHGRRWWSSSIDNLGGREYETSVDGKVYAGTSVMDDRTTLVRDTRLLVTGKKITGTSEVQEKGAWKKVGDVVCSR
jgi:hypothetical protein